MELPRTRNSREVQLHFVGITINHHGLQKRSQESFKSHHLFNGNQSWTIKMYKFNFFFFFLQPTGPEIQTILIFFCIPIPRKFPVKMYLLHSVPCLEVGIVASPDGPHGCWLQNTKRFILETIFSPKRTAKKDKRTFSVERNAENFNS